MEEELFSFPQLPPVVGRVAPGMRLHVFPEEGDVGESQVVGNLLDGAGGIFQLVADVCQDVLVDPLEGGLSAHCLAYGGEVFGRDVQFVRILGHATRLDFAG